MIGEIVGILFIISAYLCIGMVIGCKIDCLDDEVMWAFTVFWAVLLPMVAIVCLIKVLVKLFKGDLF